MKIGGGAVIRAGLFDFSGRAFGVSIAEQFGTGDWNDGLAALFFQLGPTSVQVIQRMLSRVQCGLRA